jgi:integrase/recombinase XerD
VVYPWRVPDGQAFIPGARTEAGGASLTSINVAISSYLDHVTIERGLSAHTVAAYRRDLDRYAQWCAARNLTQVELVQANDVADFAAGLRTLAPGRPLASTSAARIVVSVRCFHRFAQAEGLTDVDPSAQVRPPSTAKRLPKGLPYHEIEALLAVAALDQGPIGLRDRALLEFLYGTGTRISEAVALEVDELDLATRTVTVMGKGSKQRRVPLGDFAIDALQAYLVRGRPALLAGRGGTPRKGSGPLHPVFVNARGGVLSRQSAFGLLQRIAERAGIEHVSPHTLRHSFATHLIERGADVRVVQELLGHASVTTTQVYTMVTVDLLREVYATSHPRAR